MIFAVQLLGEDFIKGLKYQTKYLQLFSLANLGDNSGVFTRILSLRLASWDRGFGILRVFGFTEM